MCHKTNSRQKVLINSMVLSRLPKRLPCGIYRLKIYICDAVFKFNYAEKVRHQLLFN